MIHGLRLSHDRARLARGTLEGVAFCLADVWDAVHAIAGIDARPRLTGRITTQPAWAQIVADVLGSDLDLIEAADASPLGAAMVGHLALGHVDRLDDLPIPAADTTVAHDSRAHAAYDEPYRRFRALARGDHG
jgi:sugar (pentulose or hexulose) kinase